MKIKTLIASAAVVLSIAGASAQHPAIIEVSYTALSTSLKDGKGQTRNQYILLTNADESKFYSPRTEFIDSLNSTPEGQAKYQEMSRSAYMGGNMDNLPTKDGSYYIIKSLTDKLVKTFDTAGLGKFRYDEPIAQWEWQIGDSTKTILGYECVEATTSYHGRDWTVWFAPEIPLQNGPWKFDGLPGLILGAESVDGQYAFEATGIQQSHRPIEPVYLADDYEKTTRKDFLKSKREFIDNTLNVINAQFGGMSIKKVEDKDGNNISNSLFVSRETVDFIETDY